MYILLFNMYNGFIFDEKGVFYILTSFSFFTENVLILSTKILIFIDTVASQLANY